MSDAKPAFILNDQGQRVFKPKVQICDTLVECSRVIARQIIRLIMERLRLGTDVRLGLATGGAPLGIYQELRRAYFAGEVDFSRTHCFNLDEYLGLPPDHPSSFHRYMEEQLYQGLMWSPDTPRGFHRENVHIPKADKESDAARFAVEYEELLSRSGPIDLQLLGIGENGHIAFCEPGSPVDGGTAVVSLTESTRRANARFFGGVVEEVPTRGITMGIGSILRARSIVVIAGGANKRDAVRQALHGEISERLPASLLRLHPDVTFVVDAQAI